MLIAALGLVAAAIGLYILIPALFIYWPYPWPVYALLLAAVGVAFMSRRRGWRRTTVLGFTAGLATMFIVFTVALSRLAPPGLAVNSGDAFPDFTLRTSTQDVFSPSSIKHRSAALYVFYRGDW